jgi:hypothetical protein
MKYLFLKNYNPAYDFCSISYLKEGGIDMAEIPWERARFRLQLQFERKDTLTRHQEFFFDYAQAWVRRPRFRPALYDIFWHIFGHLPSLAEVKEQESKLPKGDGKLLFSAEEIADDIYGFYRKYIGDPLRRDLSGEATDDKLSRYLNHFEWTAAKKAGKDSEGFERETRKAAKALLEWCDKMTPSLLLKDMEEILAEHREAPPHMLPNMYPTAGDQVGFERCSHSTEYLKLSVTYDTRDGHTSALLTPIRGEAQVRRDWLDVDFPWYYVLPES